jgi:peptidoglycan/LPS O-acetylase OafA/YrhL
MKLNSVRYLRAIAVMLVVYCHAIDKPLLLIGSASYGIYLIHPLCFSFTTYIARGMPDSWTWISMAVYVVATMTMALLAGRFYYLVVETRIAKIVQLKSRSSFIYLKNI